MGMALRWVTSTPLARRALSPSQLTTMAGQLSVADSSVVIDLLSVPAPPVQFAVVSFQSVTSGSAVPRVVISDASANSACGSGQSAVGQASYSTTTLTVAVSCIGGGGGGGNGGLSTGAIIGIAVGAVCGGAAGR